MVLSHPESKDLAFLYGTIVTDGKDNYVDGTTKNICIFADKEVSLLIANLFICIL